MKFLEFNETGSTLHIGRQEPASYEVWRLGNLAEPRRDIVLPVLPGRPGIASRSSTGPQLEHHLAERGRYRWALSRCTMEGGGEADPNWYAHAGDVHAGAACLLGGQMAEANLDSFHREPRWRKAWALRCLYTSLASLKESISSDFGTYVARNGESSVNTNVQPRLAGHMRLLDTARQLDPSLTDAHFWYASLALNAGAIESAYEACRSALAQRGNDPALYNLEADILKAQGSIPEAAASLDRAILLLRTNITSRLALVDKEALTEAMMLNETTNPPLVPLLTLDWTTSTREIAAAIEDRQRVELLALYLQKRARFHLLEGEASRALNALDESIKLIPSGEAYKERAEVHKSMGNLRETLSDYGRLSRMAIKARAAGTLVLCAFRLQELAPESPDAAALLATVVRHLIDLVPDAQERVTTAQHALALEGIPTLDLGDFAQRLGDDAWLRQQMRPADKPARDVEESTGPPTREAGADDGNGALMIAVGRTTYSQFGASINGHEDLLEGIYALAHRAFSEKNHDLAEKAFLKLTVAAPLVSHYWRALGAAYQDRSEFRKAIEAYDLALLLDASDMVSLTYRGESKIRSGLVWDGLADLKVVATKEVPAYEPWVERSKMLLRLHDSGTDSGRRGKVESQAQPAIGIAELNDVFERHLQAGEYEQAGAMLVRALCTNPNSDPSNFSRTKRNLRSYYEKLGLREKALRVEEEVASVRTTNRKRARSAE